VAACEGEDVAIGKALLTLADKELIYQRDDGAYMVYEKFFGLWLKNS